MNEIQNIDTLTAEILMLKAQTAQNIIEIGKRLIAVKESLPHGEWGKYLAEKVEFADRTARQFMKVAHEFGDSEIGMRLPISKVYALLDLPAEERENFVKSNPVEEMTTRELQQAIKEKQDLENRLKKNSEKISKLETEKTKIKNQLETVKSKNHEELVNREVEIENLKIHIADMEKKLAAAQESGNSEEVESLNLALREANNSFEEANKKIEELEKQLKEKPIDVITAEPQIIEKVPEEIEKELKELREKLKNASNSNEPIVKFSIYFSELVKNFKELLAALQGIQDEQTNEKYKNAVLGLINKMCENL